MSLISGSYSRGPEGVAAALLRDDMVEKEAAAAVRGIIGEGAAVRRAIGLTTLQLMADRCRSVREAVLHRLRLKADILKLASAAP